MSKVVNVEVSLKEVRGDQNRLIRKFIKKCKKERIIENYLERSRYIKPSERRRMARKRSDARRRKELAKRQR